MPRNIEQKLAEAQARVSRLKEKARANETRQKIVIGALVISEALKSPDLAKMLVGLIDRDVTRENDLKVVVSLRDYLQKLSA